MSKEDLLKRIFAGFVILLIVFATIKIVNNIFNKEYKYMTFDDEWGISTNCYIDKSQYAQCYINNELTLVKQFYRV